jgi:hypothetical protein
MRTRSRPHVTSPGGGWYGWTCPPCRRVSDALYTTTGAARASLDGHLADQHTHHPSRWPFGRRAA